MARTHPKKLTVHEQITLYNFLKDNKEELAKINATIAVAHQMFVKATGVQATAGHVNHMVSRQPEVCWNDEWLPAQKLKSAQTSLDCEALFDLMQALEKRIAKLERDYAALYQSTLNLNSGGVVIGSRQ